MYRRTRTIKILSALAVLNMAFITHLYFLGLTAPGYQQEPLEETFVDGEWVPYLEPTDGYPGEIFVYDEGPYLSPAVIEGEAMGNWFFEGSAPALLIDAMGETLWEGSINTDDRYLFEKPAPFSAYVDVGDYTGEATFVVYPDDAQEESDPLYSYTATLIFGLQ